MATVDEWSKAQGQSAPQAPQNDWAKQYYSSYQQGNRNPQELAKYLNSDTSQLGMINGNGATLQDAQKDFYNQYSNAIRQGTNNLSQLEQYKGYANAFYGGQMATLDKSYLKHLSIAAMNGDAGATKYLNAMGIKPLSGTDLWSNMTEGTVSGLSGASKDGYMKDNPYSQMTKDNDKRIYDQYSEHIRNGWQLDDNQQRIYQSIVDKWNLENVNDPYVRQREQLEKDKKSSLEAQDVALNSGMQQMDANSFQQFQQLQQNMSDRGMTDSGIAADTYMRAQMGNNQNYQQAFAQAATTKSDLQTQFNNAISGSRIEQQQYQDKIAGEQAGQQIQLQEIQSGQDKWMTESTGFLWVNGNPILDASGRRITTVEWGKLSETQRHNMVQETLDGQKIGNDYEIGKEKNANTAQKNANDYDLGKEKNDVSRQKIAADLQVAIAKNKLGQDKLTYDYAKLEADNTYRSDKISQLSDGLQNDADKAQLNALNKQASDLNKQILAYVKEGKKVPKDITKKYDETNQAISDLIGGADFKATSEGSGGDNGAYSGSYRKYGQQPKAFDTQMSQAIKLGVPFSATKQLTELIGRESDWRSNVQNGSSTAYGYGQFLKDTRSQYEQKTGLSYSEPVNQIYMTYLYAIDRYGSVANALAFWDAHKYY